ncbi:MAG: 4-(cytidine 5'-diphospho)-2-C-methyl-D-erythritol kinase [Xanthobacteraceae bacterium]
MPVPLVENAPAKINLTLRVRCRRDDGYHEIESLVAFADFGDRLSFSRGGTLTLMVRGPSAAEAGESADNLVLKAARALAARCPDIVLGAFRLDKRLPVAAGLGGGSADAGAALRLMAQANGLSRDDPHLYAAARATGADVPVCLDPRTRVMRGIGEVLSAPLALPPLPAVLVNPGVALATKAVFAGWTPAAAQRGPLDLSALANVKTSEQFLSIVTAQSNDLEDVAIALLPAIAHVLEALRTLPGCRLARMSGSGATCFGVFASASAAREAAKILRFKRPHWWVRASALGGGKG